MIRKGDEKAGQAAKLKLNITKFWLTIEKRK
jgi:hypothetical protein